MALVLLHSHSYCYEIPWPLLPMSLALSCAEPEWLGMPQFILAIKAERLYTVKAYLRLASRR
jgi:hypothetical protein